MRQTRAAARAAQDDSVPTTPQEDSKPVEVLEEVETPNVETVLQDENVESIVEQAAPKKSRGKKKGRSKKNKKTKATEETVDKSKEVEAQETQDTANDTESAVDQKVDIVLPVDIPRDAFNDDIIIERPASPTVKIQKIQQDTKSKPLGEGDSKMDTIMAEAPVQVQEVIESEQKPELALDTPFEERSSYPLPAIMSPVTRDDIAADASAEIDTSSTAGSKNGGQSEQRNRKPSQSTSLLTSPTITVPHSEDPIDAIDALEDAIEEVGRILPKITPMSPEKKPRKASASKDAPPAKRASMLLSSSSRTKPPSIPPVQTKASLARLASLKNKQSGSLLKSTQPSALTRSASVRTPSSRASPMSASTQKKPAAVTTKPDASTIASKAVDYLASKRRPISMQFPPPPQPIKSSKPLTKSTFTLPGEAYAAKRKAQLEEKQKKEEELAKKREFKARPVPSAVKARPQSMIVRQTTTSRLRTSVIEGPDDAKENIPEGAGLKRSNTVNAASNKSNLASKRASMILGRSTANIAAKPNSVQVDAIQGPTIPPLRQSTSAPRPSIRTTTQPSATARLVSHTRAPASPPASLTKTVSAEDAAVLKQKGREIFNRDRIEKESKEKERREKEEAAKRARAEAAEKGRLASREWAEKQRKRMMEMKAVQTPSPSTPVPV